MICPCIYDIILSRKMKKTLTILCMLALAAPSFAVEQVGVGSGPGTRYATDAYPGFDREEEIVAPSRKEPKWFAFINGPNRDNATDQFAYCQSLVAEGDYAKAAKHLDALVREWPTSAEAPEAQEQLAEICRDKLLYFEDAHRAYMYLLDFYALQCDYTKTADRMYEAARLMRQEGKTIVFFRFDNTVDVRRAYEACVLRAPGAAWVPQAMLTIGELREDEGKPLEAIKVYENLINIHGETAEAKVAILRQANVRMQVLRELGYNRERCRDTIDFLRLSLTSCDVKDVEQIREFMKEANARLEEESYAAAKFYDSRTRTVRSAIGAYEDFLREYPDSVHAEQVRERLAVLKGLDK